MSPKDCFVPRNDEKNKKAFLCAPLRLCGSNNLFKATKTTHFDHLQTTVEACKIRALYFSLVA